MTVEPNRIYRLLGIRLEGKGPFVREEKLGSKIHARKLQRVSAEDFIYSRLFAWRGAFGLVPKEMDGAHVSNEFPNFKIETDRVFPRFLELYFKQRQIWKKVEKYCTGTTKASRNRFKEKFFLDLEIKIPPLDEQRRIVAIIEPTIMSIEHSKRLRKEAMTETDAAVLAVSSSIFKNLKDAKSSELPLGNLSYRITKGESPRWQGYSYVEEGPIFIRSENVLWGSLDLTYAKRIPHQFHRKLSRSQLKPRDVLINLVGASIGRSAVVPDSIGEANVNQAVAVISPKEPLDAGYLVKFLISPEAQSVLHGGKVDSARPNISLSDLRALKIPLPHAGRVEKSLSIQRRIVVYLDSVQENIANLKKLQDKTEREMDELVPSILDNAFKGEL